MGLNSNQITPTVRAHTSSHHANNISIHPIYKSVSKESGNNYSSISVLLSLSKILEKLLNSLFMNLLNKYNILAPNQFGFRYGRSMQDAVASLVDEEIDSLEAGLLIYDGAGLS